MQLTSFFVALGVAATPLYYSGCDEARRSPQVQTKAETKNAIEDQKGPNNAGQIVVPSVTNKESHISSKQGNDEGTEFWPIFYNVRIKITDSLLVLFTGILAVFTFLLHRSTKQLWKSAEKEFYIVHRPRLIVRNVQIHHREPNRQDGILFVLANIGDTEAIPVVGININIKTSMYLPMIMKTNPAVPNYGNSFFEIPSKPISPDERIPIFIPWPAGTDVHMDIINNTEGHSLHFFGYILFADRIGSQRPHAFYWRYRNEAEGFKEIENADYSY